MLIIILIYREMSDCKDKRKFVIEITNPATFMTQEYVLRELCKKYTKAEVVVGLLNQLPQKIFISFNSKEEMEKFDKEFRGKGIDSKMTYKPDLCIVNESEASSSSSLITTQEDNSQRKEIIFPVDYANMINTVYEFNDTTDGLIFLDKDVGERQGKAVAWLLKKIGTNILKGQSVMNISLPVYIFDSRTMLEVFAHEVRFAPYYIERIYYSDNKIEKLKWATTLLVAHLYISPLQTKPFCPILGETFQAKIGNLNVYCEQTKHKPLIANFYCYDDKLLYKYYGYIEMTASTGANTCKAQKVGKVTLEFKDGTKYFLYFPQVWLKGLTVGKKLFNYKKAAVVIDAVNAYCSYIKFGPKSKGLFTGMFSSNKPSKVMPDIFRGNIVKLSDVKIDKTCPNHKVDKKATSFCSIAGRWSKELLFDDEAYWRINDYPLLRMYQMPFTLPSDSLLRLDLQLFIRKKEDESQIEKERLEEIQRNDRKLRENSSKKPAGNNSSKPVNNKK